MRKEISVCGTFLPSRAVRLAISTDGMRTPALDFSQVATLALYGGPVEVQTYLTPDELETLAATLHMAALLIRQRQIPVGEAEELA